MHFLSWVHVWLNNLFLQLLASTSDIGASLDQHSSNDVQLSYGCILRPLMHHASCLEIKWFTYTLYHVPCCNWTHPMASLLMSEVIQLYGS